MSRSRFSILPVISLLLFLVSCAGAPFRVSPRVEVPVDTIHPSASSSKLELRAEVLSEDEIVKLFDGNLLLAGIIPIRVALTGTAEGPELDLVIPAIDRGADLPQSAGIPRILGNRERAAAFVKALGTS